LVRHDSSGILIEITMKRSYKRHRNPNNSEKAEKPFFSAKNQQNPTFFQRKMKVGQPGDKFEKEADDAAQSVVQQQPETVQRVTLATPAEDEKLGTAEARMEKDKYIQEQTQREEEAPDMQQKDHEEELQPMSQKDEEVDGESLQKQEEEEEALQTQGMEEEEELQAQGMEEEEELQAKKKNQQFASPTTSKRIKKSKGKGKALSGSTKEEMEQAFGADFSEVVIHTDQEAQDLNQKLNAQAFTQGHDIYFNKDKFHPETSEGKKLLAHELTHVLQQNGKKKKKKK